MKKSLFILLSAMIALSSCVSQRTITKQYSPFTPDEKRLYLTMNDYEYLGEITMEVTYKTYLGSIQKILTINGESYNPRFYKETSIALDGNVRMSNVMRKALYKVTDAYPSADYILPVIQNTVHDNMFGGKEIRETLTVKVFQLRQRTQAEIDAEHQKVVEQHKAEADRYRIQNEELQRQTNALKKQLQEMQDALQRQQQADRNGKRK